jgi:hypothetical protein
MVSRHTVSLAYLIGLVWLMLAGYLGELHLLSRITALVTGFIPFFLLFYALSTATFTSLRMPLGIFCRLDLLWPCVFVQGIHKKCRDQYPRCISKAVVAISVSLYLLMPSGSSGHFIFRYTNDLLTFDWNDAVCTSHHPCIKHGFTRFFFCHQACDDRCQNRTESIAESWSHVQFSANRVTSRLFRKSTHTISKRQWKRREMCLGQSAWRWMCCS